MHLNKEGATGSVAPSYLIKKILNDIDNEFQLAIC